MNNKEKRLQIMVDEWKIIFEIPHTFATIVRKNGISIILYPNEKNHRGKPHCHAKYHDKSISISLEDFSILASNNMDNKHKNMAVEYVKENLDILKQKWAEFNNEIIL